MLFYCFCYLFLEWTFIRFIPQPTFLLIDHQIFNKFPTVRSNSETNRDEIRASAEIERMKVLLQILYPPLKSCLVLDLISPDSNITLYTLFSMRGR